MSEEGRPQKCHTVAGGGGCSEGARAGLLNLAQKKLEAAVDALGPHVEEEVVDERDAGEHKSLRGAGRTRRARLPLRLRAGRGTARNLANRWCTQPS